MIGKFTSHVHHVGHLLGTSVRHLLSVPHRLTGSPSSAAWPSLLDAVRLLPSLPARYRAWWWNLLQSDPLHVLVETLLIAMCLTLVALQRRSDWHWRREKPLSDAEVDELLVEWKTARRPLATSSHTLLRPVVHGVRGSSLLLDDNQAVLNFASHDYLSASASPILRQVAADALGHYGCGSCGPRGFYGTIDAHLELEKCMAEFMGTEAAILYSDGASAATSTVAAFAKRGDLLIVDEGVHEALLVGVSLSRATVRYFRHNDVHDLRRILEKVRVQDGALRRRPTDQRRFLVVEGLYKNWGTLCPLREIVALKNEFHYRLILDDSHGMGTLGNCGRGSLEHAGLLPMVHAEILTFSIENSLGSIGGMTVGTEEVVDHQRLSGAGYCFSASAPPFLSKVAVASIKRLQGKLDQVQKHIKLNSQHSSVLPSISNVEELSGPILLNRLRENTCHLFHTLTNSSHPYAQKLRHRLVITSHPLSPILYLRLSDQEAAARTRAEQTVLLDRIAHHCLIQGKVAIISTGGHVKKYLQLVPEPCLRVIANASQSMGDIEKLVKSLGEAVEAVLSKVEIELETMEKDKT